MKFIVQLSRIFVGVLFIFSGFVKVVDPIGFGYKLEEYFAADVFNIQFLHDLALPQATAFSIFEVVLGVLLLLGIFRKFTVWSLLGLIVFFTFLTFYSAYFNKVTDCGCFGDAIPLNPWQSFYKDLILLVLTIILVIGQKQIKPIFKKKTLSYGLTAIVTLLMGWVAYTGIKYLPIKDFRAYAIGKSIPEGMKSAEELGLEPPQFEVIYTMQHIDTGETVKITDEQYLNDSKWYEEGTPWAMLTDLTETKKTSEGYEPPIHDFLLDCDEGDMTDHYLEQPKVAFYIIPFVNKVTADEIKGLNGLFNELVSNGVEVVALTAGDLPNAEFPFCFADQTTLKTIIRSNPGVVTLKNGVVTGKFDDSKTPVAADVLKALN